MTETRVVFHADGLRRQQLSAEEAEATIKAELTVAEVRADRITLDRVIEVRP